MSSTIDAETIALETFSQATSFDDLCKLMRRYLMGDLKMTPWSYSGSNKSSRLLALNSSGLFIPTDYQPTVQVYGKYVDETWFDDAGTEQGNWFYDYTKTSYLTGFMKRQIAQQFIEEVGNDYPWTAVMYDFHSDKYLCDTINSTKPIVVGTQRVNRDINKLLTTPWTPNAFMDNTVPKRLLHDYVSRAISPLLWQTIHDECIGVLLASNPATDADVIDMMRQFSTDELSFS